MKIVNRLFILLYNNIYNMSNVKLHLPFYSKNIVETLLKLVNKDKNILVQHVSNLDNSYEKIGKFIFDKNNKNRNIILLGDTKDLKLPIPRFSKFIIPNKKISKKTKKMYDSLNYIDANENDLINDIDSFLNTQSSHTAKFQLGGKERTIDVYKLWYVTKDEKHVKLKSRDVSKAIFGTSNINKIKNTKLWGGVKINDLQMDDDHMMRITLADLDTPILFTINKKGEFQMIDGLHRLVKAMMIKSKDIYGINVPHSLIKKTQIK
ncbi:MAG: hypothetical protein CMF62_00705 [Magnetococcales bacterium]|nr:hypothetical protein [Magnetococcales bacterium]|tara:strand:+ start:32036 stop:32827 length:792 start_codon:yes stop_codon:yes gene_type:complete